MDKTILYKLWTAFGISMFAFLTATFFGVDAAYFGVAMVFVYFFGVVTFVVSAFVSLSFVVKQLLSEKEIDLLNKNKK